MEKSFLEKLLDISLRYSIKVCSDYHDYRIKLFLHRDAQDKDNLRETINEKSAEGIIRKLQNEIVELDARYT